MLTVYKAVPCVVQDGAILCFRHPTAGNQIPKGTVEADESFAAAALRELEEESGLRHAGRVEPVGALERLVGGGPLEAGDLERHVWNVFLLPAVDLPRSWTHTAMGSPEEMGLRFEFFWQPLSEEPDGFADVFLRVIEMVIAHIDHASSA